MQQQELRLIISVSLIVNDVYIWKKKKTLEAVLIINPI